MFKFFWVGEEEDTKPSRQHEIELEIDNEQSEQESEFGQVAVDILDTWKNIVIVSPIAGIELESIDIVLHENTLTIKGNREQPAEIYGSFSKLKNSECFWGKFLRNIILPENLDFQEISASMENNLLVITIPKIRFDSKQIKINHQ